MPKVTFITADGERRDVDAKVGKTLLDIAQQAGLDLEGACEGALSCSTCHLVVDPSWYSRLEVASEDEEDMLDLAFGLTKTSRLGCQVVMKDAYDGLVLRLPAGSRNALRG